MNEDLKIIENIPDQSWVERLRNGNVVWLIKEKLFAIIENEFDPPEPGSIAGRLEVRKFYRYDPSGLGTELGTRAGVFIGEVPLDGRIKFPNSERWFIRANGTGLDYKPLILPVEGHLADDPPPIDEPVIRQLKRTIANLEHRLTMVEQGLWLKNALSGLTPTTNYPRRKPRP